MSTMTIHHPTVSRPVSRPTTGTLRLTRRGRLVVLTLALLAVLAAGIVIASGSVATDEPGTPVPTRVVMVGTGDTLWDIAADAADDGDVRAMIDRIERLNALDTGMVSAGQKLLVPTE
ncbi:MULTISPECIES: LysM peptidoglycan-binding domain-containing protein [unclassified Nocardioides]|uniref:LysM peptidoglycan-binding domain-containing protein n=1 Tax=unclassified Nocardioides TaxID=2615069 RepID=UPI0009F13DFE|nr:MULTISPECIES: LysM peptidoglycan-binding domain-containing protein [unclassified Nocardioides]GAW49064.1 peptidoglycan-binding LysM [Nocardioides sp. PD653-B2]GAW53220.1 peptidoglycan-binding LysM [Nocardioides sp. PD653]